MRGDKVISRFLSREPQHLERFLDALQAWSQAENEAKPTSQMIWEEKYAMLLWISFLIDVPFDLASMSSDASSFPCNIGFLASASCEGLPVLAKRLLYIAHNGLRSPGKESKSAISILVRLALRRDMVLGFDLFKVLLMWSLTEVSVKIPEEGLSLDHYSLAQLSFLGDLLKISPEPLFRPLFHAVAEGIFTLEYRPHAVTDRVMIRIWMALTLQGSKMATDGSRVAQDAVNTLLDHVQSGDTSVRFKASKAIAKLAHKMPQIAFLVRKILTEDLCDDFVFEDSISNVEEPSKRLSVFLGHQNEWQIQKQADFSQSSVVKWHGINWTISYLTHFRSIPPSVLWSPITCMVEALNFEQKNSLGTSSGSNVRDAACFGIWSVARKYSTSEICGSSPFGNKTLQALATQLILAASLDPVGNVRRAASAALQEMIGRHPNTINCGTSLDLIRIVDFHAVASRRRSMFQVALAAATVDKDYLRALSAGFVSWRGLRFEDVAARHEAAALTRREAASAFSQIVMLPDGPGPRQAVKLILEEIKRAREGRDNEKHGLIYALSEVVRQSHHSVHEHGIRITDSFKGEDIELLWEFLCDYLGRSKQDKKPLNAEYGTLEAYSALVSSLADFASCHSPECRLDSWFPTEQQLDICLCWLSTNLKTHNKWVRPDVGAICASSLVKILNMEPRGEVVKKWIVMIGELKGTQRTGPLAALGASLNFLNSEQQNIISDVFTQELDASFSVEVRTRALYWLDRGVLKSGCELRTNENGQVLTS